MPNSGDATGPTIVDPDRITESHDPFRDRQRGATAIECAMVAAIVASAIVLLLTVLGDGIHGLVDGVLALLP
ncbi:MAG: Flp family type IVb pilin [Acidimicrobiia bacterium]